MPIVLSQQLNKNVFSLSMKTPTEMSGDRSSVTPTEMSGDRSSVGKLFQTTGPLTAKLLFP